MMKIKTYIVWYTKRSKAKVRAIDKKNARKQAWRMLGDYKYGWKRNDFLKNATVTEVL